jgi:hypothetical protein
MKGVQIAIVFLTLASTPLGPHDTVAANDALSTEEVYGLICQPQYVWDCRWFVQKAWDESNFIPSAVNYDCDNTKRFVMRCIGLLQLWDGHGSLEELLDPQTNVDRAYRLYLEKGKGPWGG